MEQERVLSYGDVLLRRGDVDLLRGPEFLNDHIIDFFFSYLSSENCSSELLLVSPSTSFWIMNCPDMSDLGPVLEPLKFPRRRMVLFPINNNEDPSFPGGGSHWSLLVYHRPSNRFLHFDSMNDANEEYAKILYKRGADFLGPPASKGKFSRAYTPQQENGYDCGVYVMAIAQAVKQGFNDGVKDLIEVVERNVTTESVSNMRQSTLELIETLRKEV